MAIRFCESLGAGQIREMHQIYNQSFERIRTGEDRFRERLGLEGPVCALMGGAPGRGDGLRPGSGELLAAFGG